MLRTSAYVIRPLGVITCILGHYLLFSPIIKLISWIPFVGWLLSSLAAVAAFLFAVIVGLNLALLTIAIAWLFYRPYIGVPLLLLVATTAYMIFFWTPAETTVAETDPALQVPASNELGMVSRALIKSNLG